MPEYPDYREQKPYRRIFFRIFVVLVLSMAMAALFLKKLIDPPADFPVPYSITIDHGQTLFSVSSELVRDHVIRSSRVFEAFMLTLGSDKQVSEGEYVFDAPLSVYQVAFRISGHRFGVDKEKITFPEGFTVREMAMRLSATYPSFDANLFTQVAGDSQGYLFPDTYRFFPSVTPDAVIAALKENYQRKIAPLKGQFASSGYSEKEIITMGSIVEKEASGTEDQAIIAGILWHRIDIGMPLQVDAPFLFLLGKQSKDLTHEDLATVSPYNTYINKGLPPTPINNPGMHAITAALHPEASPYLYYLHDAKGGVHYARTFAEHKKNIKMYLRG